MAAMAVAEPLHILTPRRPRINSFRKCLKKQECMCTAHPLEMSPSISFGESSVEESMSVCSDSDNSVDSSYNESIVSTALTEYSFMSTSLLACSLLKQTALRLPTTSPSVFTTLANAKATPYAVSVRPTQSKLLKLFRLKESLLADPLPELKRSLSSLASSVNTATLASESGEGNSPNSKWLHWKLLRNGSANGSTNGSSDNSLFSARKLFLALFMNYSMLGLLALSSVGPEHSDPSVHNDLFDEPSKNLTVEEELITYSEYSSDSPDVSSYNGSRARNREYRINCDFLKRYALDYSARANFLLPSTIEDVDIMVHKGNLSRFDTKYGLARISDMSREKLWNLVVLLPRGDAFPAQCIDSDNFVLDGEAESRYKSIVVKKGKYIPWAAHKTGLKPAGVLRGSKSLRSTSSPTLGKTVAQYTIKGWCNERWSDISAQ
ncbi:hypothetical protein PUMCH_000826 [Australozyma saopauloensis]|uniref:Uncharacterized protein n=1 Tax=Australozyma saopauloensis TaxID=291208 RepID=A0AAX4H528_9ASCO|nr:hypothetical protein PUMCH_000826 [[Candida] saopauloensis]